MSGKDHLRLWLRFVETTRRVEGELRERFRVEFETTLPRFDVMAALYGESEGLKMSELSRRLRVSNGNVTGIVDRLVSDGLIERTAVPGDRRAMRVKLTKPGTGEFEKQAAAHGTWVDELLGDLSSEDARKILELMQEKELANAG